MDAGRLIRGARMRAGLSLRELAERARTSGSTLSAYESGRVVPRADTLARIVEAAGWRLTASLAAAPRRSERRAPAGDELWQAMLLGHALPNRPRQDRPRTPHAIFGRA